MKNWRDLSYLQTGTAKQRAAWDALDSTRVMENLKAYDPVLAGTIPLDIDIAGSDLDIICTSADLDQFDASVRACYGEWDEYQEIRLLVNKAPSSVIGFSAEGFPFEIFAQSVPVEQQNAYRHMAMEARLLEIGGPNAYQEIRKLKQQGIKTEPAFALYFGIVGADPYQALFELESYSQEELFCMFGSKKATSQSQPLQA
ncbi:DUF4269 domain-containing protein [Brevibacillus nitrificans]|uniref:DUF4269 domain-containing protein n=1 Tax=Brevibacillus nitrificans TaxID=651560 RepID=UPI0028655E78|nr:DUF4269 domain-containing protein [Brevibacillus nitrificans]MDR7318726.1 hypothetical protein [Brevibacillus nitrificans]